MCGSANAGVVAELARWVPYNEHERCIAHSHTRANVGWLTGGSELSPRSMAEIPRNLPRKLKEIRVRAGLSKTAMIRALKYKVSALYPSDISQLEQGDRQPPYFLLMAYSSFRGVSMSVLTDDDLTLD